jgi:hypothetical protein
VTKFFKVYSGPGYPVDPQLEKEREYAESHPAMVGPPNGSVNANSSISAWVSAADTVTVLIKPFHADNEGKLRFQTWLADQRN